MNRSGDWLKQAGRDLDAAVNSRTTGLHEWAAFAAQQAAEKAAKALVESMHGATRGHSVTALLEHAARSVTVTNDLLNAARELDQVYLTSRYPNGFASGAPGDYFTDATSTRLIGHAREIVEFCRSHLG